MKVSFYSFAVNDRFPVDIAVRQFKKHIKDVDWEYILFNDAFDERMMQSIDAVAAANNIRCVRVPQAIHSSANNPSVGLATTLNWAVRNYAVENRHEIIVLAHTDVFPICDVSVQTMLGNHAVASCVESRLIDGAYVTYFYPALTVLNMAAIAPQEIDFGLEAGLDTGGRTKYFIASYPDSVKFLANHQVSYFLKTLAEDEPMAKYFKEDLEICRAHGLSAGWIAEGFYHYMAGSQWNSKDSPAFADGHGRRMKLFMEYFKN